MHVTLIEQEQRDEEHQPDQPPVNVRKAGGSRNVKSAKGMQERGFAIVGVCRSGSWQRVSVSGLLTAISVGPRCGVGHQS
jgi:hypothetical protein